MTLPPDIAAKVLTKDLANLVARVQSGGKLTRAERAMLQNLANGAKGPTSAKTTVELAEYLGVARQVLNRWKKLPDAPKADANGTLDVAAWRAFMAAKGLKSNDVGNHTEEELQLRARKLLAEVEDRELKVAVKRGIYVPVDKVQHEWTRLIGRATTLLRNKFENELPPILSGLDATAIQDECRKAIDEVLSILHGTT